MAQVVQGNHQNRTYQLILDDEASPQALLRQLVEHDVDIKRFEVATPPLEQIFIRVVGGEQ